MNLLTRTRRTRPVTISAATDPADHRARVARLHTRTALGVDADTVDRLADRSWDDAVADVLATSDPSLDVPVLTDSSDGWETVATWWLERMADPAGGLAERMVWFWHELLPIEVWKVNLHPLLGDYLGHLRRHALGTYPELLEAVVTSGAMLRYLDADGSVASNPNENLARELMELFTIGRGNYSEDDVKAGARALAGWWVDDETAEVTLRAEGSFVAPLVFRGEQRRWDTLAVIDQLVHDPATAVRVAARLHHHLTGVDPADPAELGRWWSDRDLAVRPLLERILTSVDLGRPDLGRPRSGVEWWSAASSAFGLRAGDIWQVDQTGQRPFGPPNVAGWPTGDHWLRPGPLLGRAVLLNAIDYRLGDLTGVDDLDSAGRRLCVAEWSDATRRAVDTALADPALEGDAQSRRRLVTRLALLSPEVAQP